jgi:hypothetical protein
MCVSRRCHVCSGATKSFECQRRRLPTPAGLPSRFGVSQLMDGWRSARIHYRPICQLGLRLVHYPLLFIYFIFYFYVLFFSDPLPHFYYYVKLYILYMFIRKLNYQMIQSWGTQCFFSFLDRMAYGNDGGLVLIDIIQKSVLLSMASVDLYSSADPYTRLPRSPKRPTDSANSRAAVDLDDNSVRSPSCDQVKCGIRVKDTNRSPTRIVCTQFDSIMRWAKPIGVRECVGGKGKGHWDFCVLCRDQT